MTFFPSVSLCIDASDYLLPVCLMDFKCRMEIGVIFFSSSNQSKQAQMELTLHVSLLSELEYGHRVLLVVHAASVLEINSMLSGDLTGQRRTEPHRRTEEPLAGPQFCSLQTLLLSGGF